MNNIENRTTNEYTYWCERPFWLDMNHRQASGERMSDAVTRPTESEKEPQLQFKKNKKNETNTLNAKIRTVRTTGKQKGDKLSEDKKLEGG